MKVPELKFQMQVSPTGAVVGRHVQRRRMVSNTKCTQFLHSFPLVPARRFESSNQIPFHCDSCCKNFPKVGRSHRHQCLDSVRPAAVNRRPASKPNCGRSQKCVRASRQLAAPLALRCNARCTFVDDRPVCGYGRSLRRCPCAAARASVADRSAGARGTEFTTRTDLQSQTGTSGPKWSENQGARMFNNNLGVSHYIPPMPVDAASSRATDPSVSLIPRHCSCPSVRTDPSTSSRHECASALTVLPLSTRLPIYCTKYWRGPSTEMSPATRRA